MTFDPQHPLPGSRALVAGAARSGLAAARLLRRHGLAVTVCDRRGADAAPEGVVELAAAGVTFVWGRDDAGLLDGHDLVIWSPGIAADHPLAAAARAAGTPVLGELELGYRAARAPLVCITGTNGKSTTTDLTGALLRAAGREVAVCGNIGRAICEVAENVSESGLLVVEVSSFQLETVDQLRPSVATWLNLTPDHLDRHGTLAEYASAKQRLFRRQIREDWAITNADDDIVAAHRAGHGEPAAFSVAHAVEHGAYFEDGWIVLARRGGREQAARIVIHGQFREHRVRQPLLLANILKQSRTHPAAQNRIQHISVEPGLIRHSHRGHAQIDMNLFERLLVADNVAVDDGRVLLGGGGHFFHRSCSTISEFASISLARPQSRTRTSPNSPTMMLAGLRSRCTTPREWAKATASQIRENKRKRSS